MRTSKTMAAAFAAVCLLALSPSAEADSAKLAEQYEAYKEASAELVDLHERSVALQREIEAAAKRRNEAHAAIVKSFLYIDPDDKPLNDTAQWVADGVHEADQKFGKAHLDALDARAEADHALAENLAYE